MSVADNSVAPGPYFVVGNSRSGTTLMGRVLARSGEVQFLNEVHFFERLWLPGSSTEVLEHGPAVELASRLVATQRDGRIYREGDIEAARPDGEAVVAAVQGPLRPLAVYGSFLRFEAQRAGRRTSVEQTPRNVFFLQEILAEFPDARVINMVRDPRAALVSQKFKYRRRRLGEPDVTRREVLRMWANYHPVVTARLWTAAVRAADRQNDARVLTVRFEDLLASPEATVQRVATHCGLHYSPDMLDVPKASSSFEQDTTERGIRAERTSGWADGGLSPTELALCERAAGDEMRHHGYDPAGIASSGWRAAGWYAAMVPKLGLAAALNLRHMGNPVTAVRRRLERSR